jgi:hypothetical protein
MKILASQVQIPTITFGELNDYSIIGLQVEDSELTGERKKYILSISFNSRMYSFIRGKARWDYDSNLNDLVNRTLKNERCKLFVFENLQELAKWILD